MSQVGHSGTERAPDERAIEIVEVRDMARAVLSTAPHPALTPEGRGEANGPAAARRHLCIVSETYPPEINGVAMTLGRLAAGLRARGWRVSVVRPRQPAADGRGAPSDTDTLLVRGAALPGYHEVRLGGPAGRRLTRAWGVDRPDAVYVATEGLLGWSAARVARRLGVPAWSGFHTNFHAYSRHYRIGWLAPVVLAHLRRFHNRTRGTFVASDDLRERLRADGFANLHVLGRGVDSRRFAPERRSSALRRAWGAADEDVVVAYVGRLAPEKNVPLAIETYRAIQRVAPATRLVIVGDGPMRAALERDHPDVRFCGMQTGLHLAAHYASADVFLFPSETETFGNVTLEAMASGLAVVAYDYAAARMHIAPGRSGVVVPPGDARAFVTGASALVRQPRALADMRRRARAHAESVDWDRVVGRFEAVLTGADIR